MLRFSCRMSLVKLTAVAAGALSFVAAAPAFAQANVSSVTVNVSAQVAAVCKLESGTYLMTLETTSGGGQINPEAAGPAQGDATVTYRCTSGTAPVFTINGGSVGSPPPVTLNRTGGGSMSASLSVPTAPVAGTGMGASEGKSLVIRGTILKAGYENAPAGNYSGSFLVGINF